MAEVSLWVWCLLAVLLLYIGYRTYFKGRIYYCEHKFNTKSKNIGKPIPAFPNGWYMAIRSELLERGKSEAVDIAGENIVVFRSSKGKPYALEAYCRHLGANLGIGGMVINEKCIQCPFHGWLYDGETGICVGNFAFSLDYNGKPMEVMNV